MSHDVFISYSSQDKSVADAACAVLEQNRIRCWMAPRDIVAGRPYAEALVEAISSAQVFVLIFSDGANSSDQVLREVERAVSKGIPILPFRIQDIAPTKSMEYFLSSPHWLDALTPPLESHLQILAKNVHHLLSNQDIEPSPPPVVQQVAPLRWRRIMIAASLILLLAIPTVWTLVAIREGMDKGARGETSQLPVNKSGIHVPAKGPDTATVPHSGDDPLSSEEPTPIRKTDAIPDGQVDPPFAHTGDSGSVVEPDKQPDHGARPPPTEEEGPRITVYETEHDGAGAALLEKPDFRKHVAGTFDHKRLTNGTSVVVVERKTENAQFGNIPWVLIQVIDGPDVGKTGWALQRDVKATQRTIREAELQKISSPTPEKVGVEDAKEQEMPAAEIRLRESVKLVMDDARMAWKRSPSDAISRLQTMMAQVQLSADISETVRKDLVQSISTLLNAYLLTGKWESKTLVFDLQHEKPSFVSGTYQRKGTNEVGKIQGYFQGAVLELRFLTSAGNGDMHWTLNEDLGSASVRWRIDGERNRQWNTPYNVWRIGDE